MTLAAFRSAVTQEVETWRLANFPDLPAFYENGPVCDESSIGMSWLDVSVRPSDTRFLTAGNGPKSRSVGVVSLQLYHKSSEGIALPDQVLASLAQTLQARRLGGATLFEAAPSQGTHLRSWYKAGLMVRYQLDSN